MKPIHKRYSAMPKNKHRKRRARKSMLWFIVLLSFVALAATAIPVCIQLRQDNLDAALIQAVKHRQAATAILLLNQGANARTLDMPYKPLNLQALVTEIWARHS